jgi:hypothetical protein
MWRADDSDLDRAIDEVARQMTAGEPDASLRARVIERLGHDGERRWTPASGPRWVWILSPVALAAIIVVAVLVGGGRHAAIAPARSGSVADRTTAPATPAVPSIAAQRAVPAIGQLAAAAPASSSREVGAENSGRATGRNGLGGSDGTMSTKQAPDVRRAARARDGALPSPFAQLPLTEESIRVGAIPIAPLGSEEPIAVDPLPSIAPIAVAPLGDQGDRP